MRGALALHLRRLATFVALLLFVVGCGDNLSSNRPDGGVSSAKDITAFSFSDAANTALSATVNATLNGDQISATVPTGTNVTALVATFSTTGRSVLVGSTPQTSAVTANDFSSPVTYQVVAEDGSMRTYTVTVTVAANTAKELTAFSFTDTANTALSADVTATINGNNITATVPFGTNVAALVATFSTTGSSVTVGGTAQVSGTTANNFASPVTYRVTAGDGSTRDYTVTVTVAANTAKDITAFSFTDNANTALSADVTAQINGTAIAATVPSGTDVSALVASFTTTGTGVTVGGTAQVSGTTANDFASAVTYRVTAADGSTKDYTVTVTIAQNSAKDITAFSFTSTANPGVITADVDAQINGLTIAATVPFGTNVTGLKATFVTSGDTVTVNGTAQVSGMTANDFSSAVTYRVTADDGSFQDYTVTVTIAVNTAKAITDFRFLDTDNAALSTDVIATITDTTITATVPFGTDVSALVAMFSTTGVEVTVGGTTQASGTTPNNFGSTVTYRVRAADNSTQDYAVTITIAPNTAKEITAFSFLDVDNPALTADISTQINGDHITATVPFGTNVSALVATFSTTGDTVTIGGVAQNSGLTPNNFAAPVIYRVTAEDTTFREYTVTVTVAANPAKAITAFTFTSALNPGLGADVDATINDGTNTITATVPFGTNVTALVATFSTTGVSVAIGGTAQSSGITTNNFTGPVVYTVTAADTTSRIYTVTVTIAPSSAKQLTAFAFLTANNPGLTANVTGTIDQGLHTVALTVPFGTTVTALKASFAITGIEATVNSVAQVDGVTANNFSSPVVYRIRAADNSTQDYTVTVTVTAPSTTKAITAFAFLKANNPGLPADFVGTITEDVDFGLIDIDLPTGADVTALIPTFTMTGVQVSINNVPQISSVTPVNFTSDPDYVVTAQDASTRTYAVAVSTKPYCGPLAAPTGGTVVVDNGGFVPSTAIYACDAERVLVGGASRTCNAANTWGGTAPTCDLTFWVAKVGDGTTLGTTAAPVAIEERRVSDGGIVRTLPLPVAQSGSNNPLTISGSAVTEAQLSRSDDGRFVTIGGYATMPGTASVNTSVTSAVLRVAGRIDAAGNIDTSTLIDAFSGQNIRGVTSVDGSSFWAAGNSDGVRYATLGSTGTTVQVATTPATARAIHVVAGQLYTHTATTVTAIGTGTPSTTGQGFTNVATIASAGAIAMLDLNPSVPGADTMYIANDGGAVAGTLNVKKYLFNGTTWELQTGFLPSFAGTNNTNRIAAFRDGTSVRIVVTTTQTNNNQLLTFLDDGVTLTPAVTSLPAAGTNYVFRGIAQAPSP
ncbi:MAG: hypothetical protein SFX73_11190 [Kofleriaceae bacterium]|nr:hypothetical protein [Kofleriaceae bacterium]